MTSAWPFDSGWISRNARTLLVSYSLDISSIISIFIYFNFCFYFIFYLFFKKRGGGNRAYLKTWNVSFEDSTKQTCNRRHSYFLLQGV
jgi:hypothetical protein